MYLRGGNQKGEIPGSRSNIHVCLSWVLTRRSFKGLELRGDRRGWGWGGGGIMTVVIVSSSGMHMRGQEVCESGGGRSGLLVPNKPYGLCGRNET